MATIVQQNKIYYTCEIFNQITHTRWMCFTMNKISFNEVREYYCPGLYIFIYSLCIYLYILSVLHSKN